MVLMDEFAELIWDSGTVVMQAQNSHSNNNTNSTDYKHKGSTGTIPFADTLTRSPTPEETKRMKMMMDSVPKILRFGSPEPMPAPDFFPLPDMPPTRVCDRDSDRVGKRDAEIDTHTVPWIDYPILGASDHCSDAELLTNLNSNTLLPPHSKHLDMQVLGTVPVHKSGQDEALPSNKQPSQLPLERGELGSGLINFSHFSRPIALAKASLQTAERLRSNEKASTSCNNNAPLQSMVITPPSSSLRDAPQPPSLPQPQLPGGCQKGVLNSHHHCNSNNNVAPPSSKLVQRNQLLKEDKEKKKCGQPMLAPSSVCSRNDDTRREFKRKTVEEDSHTWPEVCKNTNC